MGIMMMNEGTTATDAVKLAGLDYKTELLPMTAIQETSEGVRRIAVEGSKLHARCDTGQAFGVVGDRYGIVEHSYFLGEWLDEVCGQDRAVTCETMGTMRDGKIAFAQVRLPRDVVVGTDDVIHQYGFAMNGHGGAASSTFGHVSWRATCANAIRRLTGDTVIMFRGRHTMSVGDRIEEARGVIAMAIARADEHANEIRALARANATGLPGFFADVYGAIFPKAEDDKAKQRRVEVIQKWTANMGHPCQTNHGTSGTMWAAYNAVSQWFDHERGRAPRGSEQRLTSNLIGASARAKDKAFSLALQTL